MEAAVGEEKRRIEEQRELMEKSAEEIQEGFKKRETVLEARHQFPIIAYVAVVRVATARFRAWPWGVCTR